MLPIIFSRGKNEIIATPTIRHVSGISLGKNIPRVGMIQADASQLIMGENAAKHLLTSGWIHQVRKEIDDLRLDSWVLCFCYDPASFFPAGKGSSEEHPFEHQSR